MDMEKDFIELDQETELLMKYIHGEISEEEYYSKLLCYQEERERYLHEIGLLSQREIDEERFNNTQSYLSQNDEKSRNEEEQREEGMRQEKRAEKRDGFTR